MYSTYYFTLNHKIPTRVGVVISYCNSLTNNKVRHTELSGTAHTVVRYGTQLMSSTTHTVVAYVVMPMTGHRIYLFRVQTFHVQGYDRT